MDNGWSVFLFTTDTFTEKSPTKTRGASPQYIDNRPETLFSSTNTTRNSAKNKIAEKGQVDDTFIKRAVALKADLIISGDKALIAIQD
jgi:predicted nucleic acid-binding protein